MAEQTEVIGGVVCAVQALTAIEHGPCDCRTGAHKHGCPAVAWDKPT